MQPFITPDMKAAAAWMLTWWTVFSLRMHGVGEYRVNIAKIVVLFGLRISLHLLFEGVYDIVLILVCFFHSTLT